MIRRGGEPRCGVAATTTPPGDASRASAAEPRGAHRCPRTTRLTAPDGLAPGNGYSHAVVTSGRTAYVSGQVALDASGNLVGGDDVGAQTEQCLANVRRVLDALGVTWADVAKLGWYVVDASQVQAVRDARDRVPAAGARRPAQPGEHAGAGRGPVPAGPAGRGRRGRRAAGSLGCLTAGVRRGAGPRAQPARPGRRRGVRLPDELRRRGHRSSWSRYATTTQPPYASRYVARAALQVRDAVRRRAHGAGRATPGRATCCRCSASPAGRPARRWRRTSSSTPGCRRRGPRRGWTCCGPRRRELADELGPHLAGGGAFPDWTDDDLARPGAGRRAPRGAGRGAAAARARTSSPSRCRWRRTGRTHRAASCGCQPGTTPRPGWPVSAAGRGSLGPGRPAGRPLRDARRPASGRRRPRGPARPALTTCQPRTPYRRRAADNCGQGTRACQAARMRGLLGRVDAVGLDVVAVRQARVLPHRSAAAAPATPRCRRPSRAAAGSASRPPGAVGGRLPDARRRPGRAASRAAARSTAPPRARAGGRRRPR